MGCSLFPLDVMCGVCCRVPAVWVYIGLVVDVLFILDTYLATQLRIPSYNKGRKAENPLHSRPPPSIPLSNLSPKIISREIETDAGMR